jgi:hypothetical protein
MKYLFLAVIFCCSDIALAQTGSLSVEAVVQCCFSKGAFVYLNGKDFHDSAFVDPNTHIAHFKNIPAGIYDIYARGSREDNADGLQRNVTIEADKEKKVTVTLDLFRISNGAPYFEIPELMPARPIGKGSLKVTVIDEKNNPVPNAVIVLSHTQIFRSNGMSGKPVIFKDLSAGSYRVNVIQDSLTLYGGVDFACVFSDRPNEITVRVETAMGDMATYFRVTTEEIAAINSRKQNLRTK